MSRKITTYKGFDRNMKCRDQQYEVGKTYIHDGKVEICKSGFHACEFPLDVFGYHFPADSTYAVVEQSGDLDRGEDDSKIASSKIASSKIKIKAEIGLPGIIKAAVEYVVERAGPEKTESSTGDQSAATNTGYQSAATSTGYRSAATNTGYQSVATNTGDWSAATNTGNQSAATNTGYQSAATNTGYQSAATNTGNHSAATNTGNRSAATNTGNHSAATNTGNQSAATNTGADSVALASGYKGRVSGANGCALCLVERNYDLEIIAAWAGIVGMDGIKPETFYTLTDGKPVEVIAKSEGIGT